MKKENQNTERLFFVQDLFTNSKTVYSGHSGTGNKFTIHFGDYGKYAMKPTTKEKCEELIEKIEKANKGKFVFHWNIVPITEIELCNFYEDEQAKEYDALRKEQMKKFGKLDDTYWKHLYEPINELRRRGVKI